MRLRPFHRSALVPIEFDPVVNFRPTFTKMNFVKQSLVLWSKSSAISMKQIQLLFRRRTSFRCFDIINIHKRNNYRSLKASVNPAADLTPCKQSMLDLSLRYTSMVNKPAAPIPAEKTPIGTSKQRNWGGRGGKTLEERGESDILSSLG